MRLIDADAFAQFLKDAIKKQEYENLKIDGCLTVAEVIYAVISELDGTSLDGYKNAPTIKPERNYDEWCLDCKEYDHDRHCCPRFNRVIGSVMDEIKTDRKLEKIMKGKHDG